MPITNLRSWLLHTVLCVALLCLGTVIPVVAQEAPLRKTVRTQAAEAALGRAAAATGNRRDAEFSTAKEVARREVAADPANPLGYILLGRALIGLSELEEADHALRRAEELRPSLLPDLERIREAAWILQYQLAGSHITNGDYQRAAEVLEGANAIYRGRPEAMFTLGQIYLHFARPQDAIRVLLQAQAVISAAASKTDPQTRREWVIIASEIPPLLRQAEATVPRDASFGATEGLTKIEWGRPVPPEGALIVLRAEDQNPSSGSIIERVNSTVVTVEGTDAQGTAFIISRDGLALTSYHVVRGQRALSAVFADGTRVPAKVLRIHEATDIALIQVRCDACWTANLQAREPEVGDEVLVVGSPRGLSSSVTRGIISSVRLLDGVTYLQTDAASNPGNSGGPVTSPFEDGMVVVGVLTFGLTKSEGLAFAITLPDALRAVGIRLRDPAPE